MCRSSKWTRPLAVAVLIAVVGLLLPAGHSALAVPLQQTGTTNQLVYLDASGQLVAKTWQDSTRQLQTVWSSGNDNGWWQFVLGDFNGDGRKEIIAFQGGRIKAFNPLPSANPLNFERALQPGEDFHLLAAGDFMNKVYPGTSHHYDQLAVTYTYTDNNQNFHEIVQVYDPGNNWAVRFVRNFDWDVQAMAAGDVNRDNFSDLSIVAAADKWFTIISGQDLASTLFSDNRFCCDWRAIAVGDVDKDVTNGVADHPGNEIVRSRDAQEINSLLLGWYNNSTDQVDDFEPWGTNYPAFYSLALADVDGDSAHDQEILALRDPKTDDSPFLVLFNPSGSGMRDFEPKGDCCNDAWKQVAAGDLNGDGRAEVVIGRQSTLRVYYHPSVNDDYADFGGGYPGDGPQPAIGDLGFGSAALVVSPQSLTFNFAANQFLNSSSQTIGVSGGTSVVNWTATLVNQPAWLSMSSLQGTTPSSPRVTVNARAAGVGTSQATIRFQGSSGGTDLGTVNVTVSVTVADPGLLVYPSTVTFMRDKKAAATIPAQASISIEMPNPANGQVQWSVTANAISVPEFLDKMNKGAVQSKNGSLLIDGVAATPPDWLQFSPTSGVTPDKTNVSVIPGVADSLPAGTTKRAVLVFIPNPYRQDWVRSIGVNLVVADHVYQTRLPIIGN